MAECPFTLSSTHLGHNTLFMHRKIFLLLTTLLLLVPVEAQFPRLWGMTAIGGANNKGTIFYMDGDGTDYTTVFDFDEVSGSGLEGTLCLAPNGKLYGTSNEGGSADPASGTLFSYDPVNELFEKHVDFDGINGGTGWGGMVVAPDGLLYGGCCSGGGTGGCIYRVEPSTDGYTIAYALDAAADGSGIQDRLLLTPDGTFFGLAREGGANNGGTLFHYDPNSGTYNVLHHFDGGLNGRTPLGIPCVADDGWLYIATLEGGTDDKGILCRYEPVDNTFQKLLDFTGPNGQAPWNAPVRIGPDLLMGTTALGGSNGSGLIYRYIPSTNTLSEAYSFNGLDGGVLHGNIHRSADGTFYGMSNAGGTGFVGTIYRFDPQTNGLNTLHSLSMLEGYGAQGDMIEVGNAVSVTEHAGPRRLTLFPNPAADHITVRTEGARPVRIRDAMGRMVAMYSVKSSIALIDVEALSPGVYSVEAGSAIGLFVKE